MFQIFTYIYKSNQLTSVNKHTKEIPKADNIEE